MRVALGDDPGLRTAIELLRGEWREQTGGEFEVVPADAPADDADLIVFPAMMLGDLCENDALRPIRASVLNAKQLDFNDFYPAVRDGLLTYGGRTMALPLGAAVPLLAATGDQPVHWAGVAAPVAGEGGGRPLGAIQLLARVAAYAVHNSNEGVLFDIENLTPLLTEPPVVEALAEMVAAPAQDDAMGRLVLPSRGADQRVGGPWRRIEPLPGVTRVYNPLQAEWQQVSGAPRRVSLIGAEGRLLGVTAATRNAAAAFRLAGWLAGSANARQLAAASPAVACVRRSQASAGDNWLGADAPSLGAETAAALEEAWLIEPRLVIPRLIGVDRYMAVLEEAVSSALAQEAAPEAALQQATDRWQELTDQVGRDRQRRAYLRHLGLQEYDPVKR